MRLIEILLVILVLVVVWYHPEEYGKWKAHAEYAFILEAERIGMWGE